MLSNSFLLKESSTLEEQHLHHEGQKVWQYVTFSVTFTRRPYGKMVGRKAMQSVHGALLCGV